MSIFQSLKDIYYAPGINVPQSRQSRFSGLIGENQLAM